MYLKSKYIYLNVPKCIKINYLGHSMCILPKLMRVGLYQRWQGHELFQPQQGHNFGQRPENYQALEYVTLYCDSLSLSAITNQISLERMAIWNIPSISLEFCVQAGRPMVCEQEWKWHIELLIMECATSRIINLWVSCKLLPTATTSARRHRR